MSRAKGYKVIGTDNNEINRIQEYISAAVESVAFSKILDGIIIKNVSLVTGPNEIPHKLNRPLIGWLIIRKRANVDVYDLQDNNAAPSRTLTLQAASAVTLDLYVF